MAKKPYYITTAIAYTSGKPHIGNTYEIVLADSIARYKERYSPAIKYAWIFIIQVAIKSYSSGERYEKEGNIWVSDI